MQNNTKSETVDFNEENIQIEYLYCFVAMHAIWFVINVFIKMKNNNEIYIEKKKKKKTVKITRMRLKISIIFDWIEWKKKIAF